MPCFLILRLQGPMQAWGGHTFETLRPSELFPTRSGLVGLLGACMGIERTAKDELKAISDSFTFAVRADEDPHGPVRKMTDFHTIKDARGVRPGKSKHQEISRREYLCDARFTVAMEIERNAKCGVDAIRDAVCKPRFTPFLGRRSCPLSGPLLDPNVGQNGVVEADDVFAALAQVPPGCGTIYSEVPGRSESRLIVRDVPMFRKERQFATRPVWIQPSQPQTGTGDDTESGC